MYALVGGAPVRARTAPSPAIVRLIRVSGMSPARRDQRIVERRAGRELASRAPVSGVSERRYRPTLRTPCACVCVLLGARRCPRLDPRTQPAGRSDDLVLLDLHGAVKFDLPQLVC